MLTDEVLIEKAKKLIEVRMGWGDSNDWTNQDFLVLSEKIQEEIDGSLSHVTLKRIWGKVKYDSLPNPYTLDTLVKFAGYANWREFKLKNGNGAIATNGVIHRPATVDPQPEAILPRQEVKSSKGGKGFLKPALFVAVLVSLVMGFGWLMPAKKSTNKPTLNPDDYSFSSKKVVSEGVPNSVIFDYDATKAPTDSVIIQQSWDPKLRTTVSKNQHQHTSIYYLPDFYKAKLLVGNKIVKQHNLLIKSNGWLTVIESSPVPVYFKEKEVIANGKMALSIDKIQAQNISLSPQAPVVIYSNVQDFGEIYADNFVFETSLKNDYREGSSVCQNTRIYLLCEGTAVGIPLCVKGCVSDVDLLFTQFYASGKQQDLSAFGVDFTDFVKVRVESHQGKAKIFINDQLSYQVDHGIIKSKIIGMDFTFQGTGTVDYVKLSNGRVVFEDAF